MNEYKHNYELLKKSALYCTLCNFQILIQIFSLHIYK